MKSNQPGDKMLMKHQKQNLKCFNPADRKQGGQTLYNDTNQILVLKYQNTEYKVKYLEMKKKKQSSAT